MRDDHLPVRLPPVLLNARHRRVALWLALAAMLLRGLLPDGVMLGRSAEKGSFGYIHCSAMAQHVSQDGKAALSALSQCPFAVMAMPALPASPYQAELLSRFSIEAPAVVARLSFIAGTEVLPPARGPPVLS